MDARDATTSAYAACRSAGLITRASKLAIGPRDVLENCHEGKRSFDANSSVPRMERGEEEEVVAIIFANQNSFRSLLYY